MKCNKQLLVCLIFQALLIIGEAGRNVKPKNPKSPIPGSGPGTRGTGPGRTNSGRASTTRTNVGGNHVWSPSQPHGVPVQHAPVRVRPGANSQPPATLPSNRPQASGPLDWSKLRFSGTGPQVRPHHSGTGPQVRPHNSGTGPQVRPHNSGTEPLVNPHNSGTEPLVNPHFSGTGPQVRPHHSGTGPQVRPHYSGTGPQVRPHHSGTGPQVRPHYSGTEPQVRPHNSGTEFLVNPHNSGTGPHVRPHYSGIGPQVRPHNSGTGSLVSPHNSGTALSVRPHYPGASASHAPQTPMHSLPGTSQMGYPQSLTNDNFPALAPKPPSDFGAHIQGSDFRRSSSVSSSSLGYNSGSRTSISSIGSVATEPIGLEAPKSTAIMKSAAHPSKCVDNTGTTPKIIAPAEHCFDYFKLAVAWSPSIAYKHLLTGYQIRAEKIRPSWIIHGLWPTMFQREADPMPGCRRFDIFLNKNRFVDHKILGVLDNTWYTILAKGWSDNTKFWEHEFSKHGSCATRSSVIGDDVNYFKRTLELHHQLNIGMTLSLGGLNTGATTKLRDIIDIIERKVCATVKIDFVQNPALLMISEAGRNSKPKNPKSPFLGSGHGTRGTSPGRTNSGRASPTHTNVRGNQDSGPSHPNRAPVQPASVRAPPQINSQPHARLPLNLNLYYNIFDFTNRTK